VTIHIPNIVAFKQKALQWAAGFDVACCLDSNQFADQYSRYNFIITAGAKHELSASVSTAFTQLEQFRRQHSGWVMGFFTYDLKNEIEQLTSVNYDGLQFPDLYFFVPEHLITIQGNEVTIQTDDAKNILADITQQDIVSVDKQATINLQPRFNNTDYIDTVEKIKEHIIRGDIYVSNFCQEFFAESAVINPVNIFRQLNELSPNPFSCFFKHYQHYALCASPERFLAKRGSKLISQPIKGTAKRLPDSQQDNLARQKLRTDQKELQENVMIVDLVRNDLTHSAKPGTVRTEELFGIYSFNQVHQMISTVVCELSDSVSPVQAIRNAFPMGSMTGAPKISSMRLMEKYERSKRGLYSGAMGYFSPDGDFDFNVVIRSLLYNEHNGYLSFHAGSAITYDADAQKEYEECLVKATAVFKVLGRRSRDC
jgi:para-aminobenzoate synthetase component 1